MANVLDYGKPDPPEARLLFRILAGMFATIGVVVTIIVPAVAISTRDGSILWTLVGTVPGAWLSGQICLTGRLPILKKLDTRRWGKES